MYCRTNPPHPKRNSKGLYPLHRVVLENKLGRLLETYEHAHHIDHNKDNNSPENLEALHVRKHTAQHQKERKPDLIECICSCGKRFSVLPYEYRKRLKQNKTGMYCSRSCGAKHPHTLRREAESRHPVS